MSWVLIEPNDVWLFRDGHPFAAGEGHIARSIFPPTPLTVQGALRSSVLGSSSVGWAEFREQTSPSAQELAAIIGEPPTRTSPGTLGQFKMEGPFLCRGDGDLLHRYVPLPADLVSAEDGKLFALSPTEAAFDANWPADGLRPLWTDVEVDEEQTRGKWLREEVFQSYLTGNSLSESDCIDQSELRCSEPRYGIAIDDETGCTKKSLLYQAEFIRPIDTGLLVWIEDPFPLAEFGMIGLGGEQRSGRYTTVPDEQVNATRDWTSMSDQRLKLVFLTPAYFTGGWQPVDGNWSDFFAGGSPRLVAVALNRPYLLGGWDLANQRPRSMYPYVATGSVYFFESGGEEALQLRTSAVTQTPDCLPDAGRLGFGQVAVGVW